MAATIQLNEIGHLDNRPRRFGRPGSAGAAMRVSGDTPQLPFAAGDIGELWPKLTLFASKVWSEPALARTVIEQSGLDCSEWRGTFDSETCEGALLRLLGDPDLRDAVERRDPMAFVKSVSGISGALGVKGEGQPGIVTLSYTTLFTHSTSSCIVMCDPSVKIEVGIDVKVDTGGLPAGSNSRPISLAAILGGIEFAKRVQSEFTRLSATPKTGDTTE